MVTLLLLFDKFSFNKSALVLLVTSVAKFVVNVFSAPVALINSESMFDVNVLSVALALFTSADKFAVSVLSAAILDAVSAAKALEVAESLASTYVLIAFTVGYFVVDAPSVLTLLLLLTKSSFNKSALVLLVISKAKLLFIDASALVLFAISAAKLLVNAVSAAALIVASLVSAVPPKLILTST